MGDLLDALAVALKSGLGFQAIFFALLAIGINVQFGYAGLLNFGQIAFALLGGFGIAISVSQWGLPFWVGVIVGLLAAVVLALLLGLPTLRLRTDYLAIATIATAEGPRPRGGAPPRPAPPRWPRPPPRAADPAAADRLPRHRHDRDRRGPAAAVPVGVGHAGDQRHPRPLGLHPRPRPDCLATAALATAEGLRLLFRSVSATPVTNGTRGLSAFNGDFIALAPWATNARYRILGTSWPGGELRVAAGGGAR